MTDASRFASLIRETLIRATPAQARRVLTSAGYAAAANREFKQGAEGAALDSTVVQLASKNRAEDVLDWRHGDSLQPCRTRCAFEIRDLRVDGIPGAKGVRRTATAASLRATGDKGRPFELIEVTFVDGPFVYDILTRGPPGSVSADKAIGVAKREYERVKGAPART